MQRQWMYTGIILFLFLVLLFGVPLFPEVKAVEIVGPLNLGMLTFLVLHILTLSLAFLYLKQTRGDES